MITYFMIKLLYLNIALLQIYLMNSFLSTKKDQFYGTEIMYSIISGESDIRDQLGKIVMFRRFPFFQLILFCNIDSRIFPRITGCDITTVEIGGLRHFTFQCILSLNLFYERMYIFLWFWISIIIIPFLVYDLMEWILRIFILSETYATKFLKRRIKIFKNLDSNLDLNFNNALLKFFTNYYIGADGIFVLRLIECNSNIGIISELLDNMWQDFEILMMKN